MNWTDEFNDSSLDSSKFATSTAGTASITEGTEYLQIDLGTAVGDAGIVYLQSKIDQSKAEMCIHKCRVDSLLSGGAAILFGIINKSSAPAVNSSTNWNPDRRITCYYNDTDAKIYISYQDASSVFQWWDGVNKVWTSTVSGAVSSAAAGRWYIVQFVHTTSQFKLVVLTGSGNKVLAETDWVNFSSLKSSYADLWIFWGDPYTDFYYADVKSDYFKYGDASLLAMYYNGNNSVDGAGYRIGRCISYNGGEDYIRDPRTPIIAKTAFEAGENITDVKDPYVVKDGSTWYLFCAAANSSGKWALSVFTSTDGIAFSRSGTASKLAWGGSGAFDENGCRFPVAVKDTNESDANKRWKIYYTGEDASAQFRVGLAFAASPTDTSFTKYGSNPVLDLGGAGTFDDGGVSAQDIVADENTVRMYYGGFPGSGGHWQSGEATSPDWYAWTRVSTSPVLTRRSGVTTGVTTLTSGSVVATVSSTAEFAAKEWVYLENNGASAYELNRIESIDSGTQATLTYPAANAYSSGKMKSAYFGSVIPSAIEKSGVTWKLTLTAFQQKDDGGFTFENGGYAEGSAHDSFTYELTRVPRLALGLWDDLSAENMRRVALPVSFAPLNFFRKFTLAIDTAGGIASARSPLPVEMRGSLRRSFLLAIAFDPEAAILRRFSLPVEINRIVSSPQLGMPMEWDGAIVLRRDFPMPIEWQAALARKYGLPVEWLTGLLRRDVRLEIEARGGISQAFLMPVESAGANILQRKVRIPIEVAVHLLRAYQLPLEWAGQGFGITYTRTILRPQRFPLTHERTIIPDAQSFILTHSRTILQTTGGRLRHSRVILPAELIPLFDEDIHLPTAEVDKS